MVNNEPEIKRSVLTWETGARQFPDCVLRLSPESFTYIIVVNDKAPMSISAILYVLFSGESLKPHDIQHLPKQINIGR